MESQFGMIDDDGDGGGGGEDDDDDIYDDDVGQDIFEYLADDSSYDYDDKYESYYMTKQPASGENGLTWCYKFGQGG